MKSWPEVYIPTIDSKFDFPELSLLNSSTQKIEVLPLKKTYRMYVCGITPYDSTHLGHAATYLSFDLINRYLRAIKSEVNYVQNITDIDDPLLERAARDGVDWQDLANSQIDLFRSDMTALHIIPPKSYIGAVEAIPLVIEKIQDLEVAQSIYHVENDLYFRVFHDPEFGSRSNLSDAESQKIFAERGGDPGRSGKENPLDSLVWSAKRPNEPSWPSPFGEGRPGWHIQCISLANKYAELPLDIQGGGKDLIFPHHSMSEEQNSALGFGELALNYCHVGMVSYQGSKMSKSKGNLVFVHQLISEGISPMVIRLALMMHHWRSDWEYKNELIAYAKQSFRDLSIKLRGKFVSQSDQDKIIEIMLNDLDVPKVLSFLKEVKPLSESTNNVSIDLLLEALLGLKLKDAV